MSNGVKEKERNRRIKEQSKWKSKASSDRNNAIWNMEI
jgi:hypothetical protein